MNPSSKTSNSPSQPFGDLSKSRLIDQGQKCRHCGAPIKTFVSGFSTCHPLCQQCGRRDTDLVTWCLIDKRDSHYQRMASPEFSSLEQVQQFAALFGIRPEDDYGIREAVLLFNSEPRQAERADYISHLEWNDRVLAWLLEARPAYPGNEGLVQLAINARLTDYALPQFRHAAAKGD
jgi:hypothetical protein